MAKLFILKHDLYSSIKKDELEVLLDESDNPTVDVNTSLEASVDEVASYIRHRYDADLVFVTSEYWKSSGQYAENDLVCLWAEPWTAQVYGAGDIVERGELVYFTTDERLATEVPGVALGWVEMGAQGSYFQSLVGSNIDLPTETASWSVVADSRNKLIRRHCIDLALYSLYARINPRQIPEHRIKLRDDAIDFLKRAADPRKNVTLDLPLVDHGTNSGNDITFGSNAKNSHSY